MLQDSKKGNQAMNREDAKQEIRRRVRITDYLEKSKGGLYCCPFCGSGHGTHKTGAVKYYPETNTICCFGACDKKSYDVFDIYMNQYGADYNTALQMLAGEIGIEIDPYKPDAAADQGGREQKKAVQAPQSDFKQSDDKNTMQTQKAPENSTQEHTEGKADYTEYYKVCRERINSPEAVSYLSARGISVDTAAAYWVGYDPAADLAFAPGGSGSIKHPCRRIIIPTTAWHYIGRSIEPDTARPYQKMNVAGGSPGIFNRRALYAQDVREVFITEGAFDALSVIEAGAAAVALNSTSNADALLKLLKERKTAATLIISLDNDESGNGATQTLIDGFKLLNQPHIVANISGAYKDPNEALTKDREGFIKAIKRLQSQTAARPDNVSAYIDNIMQRDIERMKGAADRKTGFDRLDEMSGGLYPGLYVIAATSSLGKTTFSHQISDNLAAAGNDVLFFSMEQSRLELVTKSLSRITAQADIKTAVTSLSIRKGYFPDNVKAAIVKYKNSVSDRLSIVEGNFNCNISFIGDYVRKYIKKNQSKPIVIIDYLQILQPAEDNKRMSTKETVDNTVTELKRMSREHDITVFIISSVNRANYLTPIDFESLKESGGIEYTADVIWGLQLQCLNEPLFSEANKIKEKRQRIRQQKAAEPRKIELLCLKNRYGVASYSCGFDYYPKHDLFVQTVPGEFNPYYGENPFEDTEPTKKAGRKL